MSRPTAPEPPVPSTPPPRAAQPIVVQVIDQLGDVVGAVLLAWLASRRLISGELAAGAIFFLLGSQSAIRRWSAARGGAGLGGAGLVLLALAGLGAAQVALPAAAVAAERLSRP